MLVPKHARPVGVREQQVVELRQKARWRRGVFRRPRRIGQIEQRAAALVVKQGSRGRSDSSTGLIPCNPDHCCTSAAVAGPNAAR